MYRIRRVDTNQKQIVEKLRELGAIVLILSEVGRGCPDILVCHPLCPGWSCLIEIKDGAKPKSQQKLTPDEEKFHASWTGSLEIITSVKEAEDVIAYVIKEYNK